MASSNPATGLFKWYQFVATECVRDGLKCVCLYHPSLTWETIKDLSFAAFTRISAKTVEEAEAVFGTLNKPTEPESTAAMKRHLCYHIHPHKGNGDWQRHVGHLLKRIDQFNGVRSVAVVTDAESDSLATVQAAFAGHRIDHWLTFPSNGALGQSVTFAPLLETAARESGITFYGHSEAIPSVAGDRAERWEQILYELNLDDPRHILDNLQSHPITGAFLAPNKSADGDRGEFHYFGSFFWFRNADVYGRRGWSDIHPSSLGVEAWPRSLFTIKESGALFTHPVEDLELDSVWEQIQTKLTELRAA